MQTLRPVIACVAALFPLAGAGQVTADFTANVTSDCNPLIVTFQDLSSGSPNSWQWTFGNGNPSIDQNPTATYIFPGTYTVTLIVSDGTTTDTIIKTNFISVFPDPDANFSASILGGCAPLSVQFTDQSVPGSGAVNSWLWDFGEGNTSTQQNPVHTYLNTGSFSVSLIVTDVNGCTHDTILTDIISVFDVPVANFNALQFGCSVPHAIAFNNLSSGGGGLNFLWDFGDGDTSTVAFPTHVYTAFGPYTVTLIVSNNFGCADTFTRFNYINIQPIVPLFNASPTTICRGEAIQFSDQSLGLTNTYSYSWDFGDGGTSTAQHPYYSYNTPGVFTATMTVISSLGCMDSFSQVITVLPGPVADFLGSPLVSCNAPLTVSFTDNSVDAILWEWNFGDGSNSTQQNPTHTYTTDGSFDVTLTVTSLNGCAHSLTLPDYVAIELPAVNFDATPRAGCVPLFVQFSDLTLSSDSVIGWLWRFGDSATSTLSSPQHTYTDTGTFTVTLIVTTISGCTDSLVREAYIRTGDLPGIHFTGGPATVCVGDSLYFGDSSNIGQSWIWYFGNGDSSIIQDPSHVYWDTGWFNVTLIVSNNGCMDTLVRENYIRVVGALAGIDYEIDCDSPLTVQFNDDSRFGPHTWFWDFGDGATSTLANPIHTYAAFGSYDVTLVVNDTVSQCGDTVTTTLVLMPVTAGFTASPRQGCRPLVVDFFNASSGAVQYLWEFGDGFFSNDESPQHVYDDNGIFTVTLISINEHGCADTFVQTDYIVIDGPIVGFTGAPQSGCAPLFVQFTDTSSSPGSTIASWLWLFGDGTNSNLQHPAHLYSNASNYTVVLQVTDADGCSGIVVRAPYVIATLPIAGFDVLPFACPGDMVDFIDTSIGVGLLRYWDFGDGNTSTNTSPWHIYTDTGNYTVTLIVTDINGCSDTATSQIDIRFIAANFLAAPTDAACPPLTVYFTDSSEGNIISWLWDFGDGATSTLQHPTHTYARAGTFNVTLVVTTNPICHDTLTLFGLVTILGPSGSFTFAPASGCVPHEVNFVASATNTVDYTWDFGDGTVINIPDSFTSHTYTNASTYNPILLLDDGVGCVVGVPAPFPVVADAAIAKFTVSDSQFCSLASVDLVSTSVSTSGILSWQWDFGDGTTSSVENPSHTYTTGGLFGISLMITTNAGCKDTMTQSAAVSIYDVIASFTSDSVLCDVPQLVTFTNLSQSNDSIIIWQWGFGDGNVSTSQSPSNNYLATGSYPVSLLVTTAFGCSDSLVRNVSLYPKPVAGFSTSNTCHLDTTAFINLTTLASPSTVTVWSWDFGDGTNSTASNPMHVYATPGSYTVTLSAVSDAGCTDTFSSIVTVFALPNPAAAGDTTLCRGNSCVISASGGVSYSWSPAIGLVSPTQPSTVAAPDVTTYYVIEVTDLNGCREYDSVLIVVSVPPNADAGPDTTTCYGVGVQLNGSGGQTYSWSPAAGLSCTGCANPIATPPATTQYTLEATDANGCSDSDSVLVEVLSLPSLTPAPDVTMCVGDTAELTIITDGVMYQWSPSGSLSCDTCETVLAWPPDTTTYTYIVTGVNGCRHSATTTVTVLDPPVAETNGDAVICEGQSISLSASGNYNFNWQPPIGLSCTNCPNPVASPSVTTTYSLEASNGYCADDTTLTITVWESVPAIAGPDTAICLGGEAVLWALGESTTISDPTYEWQPASFVNEPTSAQVMATPPVTTMFTVVVSNATCEPTSRTIQVIVNPLPVANAGPDRATFESVPVMLLGSGSSGVSFSWSPAGNVVCETCPETEAYIHTTTSFELEVTDMNGCFKKDSTTVRLIEVCDGSLVFVPNTFTPNGDGVNDVLYVRSYALQRITAFRVFDRWGKTVFEATNADIGWDGTYNGARLDPAVFVYTVEGICLNNERFVTAGNVAIVK